MGFAKIALGMAHRALGYAWSASRLAEPVRAAVRDESAFDALCGWAWPDVPPPPDPMRRLLDAGPDRHVVLITNTRPLAAYVLLFGELSGCIPLARDTFPSDRLPYGRGIVTVVDTGTRNVFEFDLSAYARARATKSLPFAI